METAERLLAGAAGFVFSFTAAAGAAIIPVNPGESIQDAIAGADSGDEIEVAAGTYNEDIDFLGKDITVRGVGPETVIQGTGTGPVVTIVSGEGLDTVLDSVLITGGNSSTAGGIRVVDSSPTIIRNVLFDNVSDFLGSGIYLRNSNAFISNNALLYHRTTGGGDPHSIYVRESTPTIVNNTIVRGDSNGILVSSAPVDPIIRNNVIALNGSNGRGRGICDFSSIGSRIGYNLFWRNRIGALLTGGRDWRRIMRAETVLGPPLMGNVDGNPEFSGLRRPPKFGSRKFRDMTPREIVEGLRFRLDGRKMRAIDAGDPDPAYNDRDGSRNDLGLFGGPESPLW